MSDQKKLNRRDFLKGAATAGVGLAGVGALGATPLAAQVATPVPTPQYGRPGIDDVPVKATPCATPVASNLPAKWDKEADVVVVGSGTGLAGALAAAVAGSKVIVLEKMAVAGGSTRISGGVVWIPNNSVMRAAGIPDSREKALTYMRLIAEGQSDEELIVAFVDKGPEMIGFVAANTSIVWTYRPGVGDYHPEWSGGFQEGRTLRPVPLTEFPGYVGGILILKLLEGVKAKGVEVLFETPAKKLITQMLPDGLQEVLGVVAESGGKTINIKANKGVILAAGGYDWNFEMKKNFLRGPTPYTGGAPGNIGDGILMAMARGADLRNMNECWGMPLYKEEAKAANARKAPAPITANSDKCRQGAIMVNRYGERFCNEGADYDSQWRSFFAWESWGALGYRNLPAYIIMDHTVRTKYTVGGAAADKPLPAWVKQANTLRELATALGIDPAGLEKTVSEFNNNARQLKDPQFHRGESFHDQNRADPTLQGPSATLAPLEVPPFYGAEVAAGDIGTCGGLRVNANAQVLNPFSQVIPRLYACGNNSGIGSPGAGYGGAGVTIAAGMTFAYIAAKHMVTLEPWK